MPRSGGCNVGNFRCAFLTGNNEGVIYGVRRKDSAPGPPTTVRPLPPGRRRYWLWDLEPGASTGSRRAL